MRFSLCDQGRCACARVPKVPAERHEDWSRRARETADRFRRVVTIQMTKES